MTLALPLHVVCHDLYQKKGKTWEMMTYANDDHSVRNMKRTVD